MSQPDPQAAATYLLGFLRRLKDDRGAMAELRCALSPGKIARAWPLLARVNGIGDPSKEAVAGFFAFHPAETFSGNIGTTCRRIAAENVTFEARFRRLLGCSRAELGERLRPVILAAKAKDVPVNYERLFVDLSYWGNRVRAEWARQFWTPAEKSPVAVTEPESAA